MKATRTLGLTVLAAIIMMTVCLATVGLDGDDTENYTGVTNESELTAALENKSVYNIRIMNDFEISDTIRMYRTGVTLDGHGHVLTCNESIGYYMLSIVGGNCTLKNIVLDANGNANGVLLFQANGAKLSQVTIGNSTGVALTVNMSDVKITAPLSLQHNGVLSRNIGSGDYISLAWSDTVHQQGKCSVVFDSDKPLYRYDGINASIKPTDLANAGVNKDTWKNKFEVKHGTNDVCSTTYGNSGQETILLNTGVAKVGDTVYAALRDAVAVGMEQGKTVELTHDSIGGGFTLPEGHKALTIDLKNFSYRICGPLGVDGTSDNNFTFMKGDKVTILNGTIFGNNQSCKRVVESYCDIELKNATIDAISIMHEGPEFSDIYALYLNGATCVLDGSSIIGKDASNYNNSYMLDNAATIISVGEQTTVYGDSIMNGGSKLIVYNKYFEPFGVRGRGSEMTLNDGTIYMMAGSNFSMDVYCNNRKCEVGFEDVDILSDSKITSGKMVVTGAFSGSNEYLASLFVNDHSNGDAIPVYLDIIAGYHLKLNLNKDVCIVNSLVMMEGSELRLDNVNFISEDESSFLVLKEGCKVNDLEIKKDVVLEMDPGMSFKEVFVVLLAPVDHVKGFTVDGKEFYGMTVPVGAEKMELQLSTIIVDLDEGYQLTGWLVNGVQHRVLDTVTVTENTVLVPIVSEKVSDDALMIFTIIIIGLTLLAIVVPFGITKKH